MVAFQSKPRRAVPILAAANQSRHSGGKQQAGYGRAAASNCGGRLHVGEHGKARCRLQPTALPGAGAGGGRGRQQPPAQVMGLPHCLNARLGKDLVDEENGTEKGSICIVARCDMCVN